MLRSSGSWTVFDLFAGCGGASLGARQAGLRHVGAVEWDADAAATLRAAGFPVTLAGDVRDLAAAPRARGWWASPPCQDWSQAGSRKGKGGERNGFPWVWDLLDRSRHRPTWLVLENVPGILQHRGASECQRGERPKPSSCPACYWHREVLPAARERFAAVETWILDAADYGVPQHRKRVFLVCGPFKVARPTPTHADPSDAVLLRSGRKPWVSVRQALRLGAQEIVVGGGSNPRKAGDARSYNDLTDRPDWWNRNTSLDRPSRTVAAVDNVYGLFPQGRRRLTIEECLVLQGFPKDYPLQGRTSASRYRQVGNAVPPPMAAAVWRAIGSARSR